MSEEIVKTGQEELVSLAGNLGKFMELADHFRVSGVYPNIQNKFQALVILEAGRELGMLPIMAFQTIYPIKGRLTVGAAAMLGLFHARGGKSKFIERSTTRCEIELSKEGRDPGKFSFTMEEAEIAGLAGKDNWKAYPADMLAARAISRAIRAYDPGCVLGMHSTEEIRDLDEPEAPAATPADMAGVTVERYEPPKGPEPKKAAPEVVEGEVVEEPKAEPEAPKPEPKPKKEPAAKKKAEPESPAPAAKEEPKKEPTGMVSVALGLMDALYAPPCNIADIFPRVATQIAKRHNLKELDGKDVESKMTEADAEYLLPKLEAMKRNPAQYRTKPAEKEAEK